MKVDAAVGLYDQRILCRIQTLIYDQVSGQRFFIRSNSICFQNNVSGSDISLSVRVFQTIFHSSGCLNLHVTAVRRNFLQFQNLAVILDIHACHGFHLQFQFSLTSVTFHFQVTGVFRDLLCDHIQFLGCCMNIIVSNASCNYLTSCLNQNMLRCSQLLHSYIFQCFQLNALLCCQMVYCHIVQYFQPDTLRCITIQCRSLYLKRPLRGSDGAIHCSQFQIFAGHICLISIFSSGHAICRDLNVGSGFNSADG